MKTYQYFILSLFCFLTACGGGDDKPAKEQDKPTDKETLALDCTKVSSDTQQAIQGGIVSVTSDDPINHAYYLHTKADATTQEIEIILEKGDDDYTIALPYLPELADGGDMRLAVSSARDTNRCNLPAVSLAALPATDFSVADDFVDEVEAMINKYMAMLGFSESIPAEEYQSDPLLFSAALANAYFFDADSEISVPYLRNLLTQLTNEEKTYLARVIVDANLIEQVQSATNDFESNIASIMDVAKAAQIKDSKIPIASARAPLSLSRTAFTSDNCKNSLNDPAKHRVQISDLKSLSVAMKLAEKARQDLAKAAKQSQTKDNILSGVGAGAAIAGGPAGALIGAMSALPGIMNFYKEHSTKQLANLLPSEISDIDLRIVPKTRLEEDFTEKASNPFWNATVTVASKGLNLSKQIVDAAFTAAGAAPGIPAISNINMTGVSKVSGKVFNNDNSGTDCGLIVQPQSWSVPVTNNTLTYIEQEIEGNAFSLEANRKLKPIAIGVSTLKTTIKSSDFPSAGSTLATYEKTIDIENVIKSYSSLSTVIIQKAGDNVGIDITAIDIADVESYKLDLGDGLNTISQQVNGNMISLTMGTTDNEDQYPLSFTITSTSKNLDPASIPRSKTIKIDVSPIKVTINQTSPGKCNEDDAYEIDLTAVVENAKNNTGVEWSLEGSGGVLSPEGNDAFFTTTKSSSFVVTATSKEDEKAKDSITINPIACKASMFINTQVGGSIDSPSTACNDPSNPQKYEANDVRFGSLLEDLEVSPSAIKARQLALSEGTSKSWNSFISELTINTELDSNGNCTSFSGQQSAESQGEFSVDNDNGIAFNQTLSHAGYCYKQPDSTNIICQDGKSQTTHIVYWLFDHESATTYELTNNMICTTPPLLPNIPVIPVSSSNNRVPFNGALDINKNMNYSVFVFDEKGGQITPDFENGIFWNPSIGTSCYNGKTPIATQTWNIPDLGKPVTVVIGLTFINTITNQQLDTSGLINRIGSSVGTVRVKTKKLNDEE